VAEKAADMVREDGGEGEVRSRGERNGKETDLVVNTILMPCPTSNKCRLWSFPDT
jgi:hypothetical protein